MDKVVLLAIVSCCFAGGAAVKSPKNWKFCKKDANLNACLKNAIQVALPDLVKGSPALNVHPLDPLRFNTLIVDQGTGPVAIKLEFFDIDLLGIKDIVIDTVDADWVTMNITVKSPKLSIKGKYRINGKVLVLPIQGEGDCLLDLHKFIGYMKIKFVEKKIAGKVHYYAEQFEFYMDVNPLVVNFSNLFNGDKALGDNMNKFLNENWKEILRELAPAISKSFGEGFREVSNRLFSRLTKSQITPA